MKVNLSLSVNIKLSFTEREIEVLDDALNFYQEREFKEFGYYSSLLPNVEYEYSLEYIKGEILKALQYKYNTYKQTSIFATDLSEKTKEVAQLLDFFKQAIVQISEFERVNGKEKIISEKDLV